MHPTRSLKLTYGLVMLVVGIGVGIWTFNYLLAELTLERLQLDIQTALEEDYQKDGKRNLPPQLVQRIVDFSQEATPPNPDNPHALPSERFSADRGKLLVYLLQAQLDTATYDAIYTHANFEQALLSQAPFTLDSLPSPYLSHSNLAGADFTGTTIPLNSNFEQAKLQGSSFLETAIRQANFQGAYLEKANFQNSVVQMCNFQKVLAPALYGKGSVFIGVDMRAANFTAAEFDKTAFTSVQLQKANLKQATFLSSRINNSNWQAVQAYEANLTRATLYRVNLRSAKMQSATLRSARLLECGLHGLNLDGCICPESIIDTKFSRQISLEGAYTKGMKLGGYGY